MNQINLGNAPKILMFCAVVCLLFAFVAAMQWFGLTMNPTKPALLGFVFWSGAEFF